MTTRKDEVMPPSETSSVHENFGKMSITHLEGVVSKRRYVVKVLHLNLDWPTFFSFSKSGLLQPSAKSTSQLCFPKRLSPLSRVLLFQRSIQRTNHVAHRLSPFPSHPFALCVRTALCLVDDVLSFGQPDIRASNSYISSGLTSLSSPTRDPESNVASESNLRISYGVHLSTRSEAKRKALAQASLVHHPRFSARPSGRCTRAHYWPSPCDAAKDARFSSLNGAIIRRLKVARTSDLYAR